MRADRRITETTDSNFTADRTTASGTITAAGTTEAFTNTRATGDLTLSKVLVSDRAADADQVFNFTVALSDNTISGDYGDMTFTGGVANVELKGGEDATATGLPTDITYTITETEVDGFELTSKPGYTGTISLTKSSAVFTNTRDTGDLEVKKTVPIGSPADPNKEFEFTVTLSDTTIGGATGKDYGDMTFINGVATFTLEAGETATAEGLPTEIDYTVEEVACEGYDTVPDNDTGSIVTGTTNVEFVNTYDATGTFEIPGAKTIENRNFTAYDTLKVTISSIDGRLPDEPTVTVTIVPGESTAGFSLGEITYQLDDLDGAVSKEFTYTVTEEASMKGTKPVSLTDEFTVTVTDQGNGHLLVKPSYTKDDEVTFTNTYEAKGEIKFYAKKELIGRELTENEFEFQLFRVVTNANNTETLEPLFGGKTFKNKANALIEFDTIEYTQAEMLDAVYDLDEDGKPVSRTKTITYRMKEVPGTDTTVIYDTKPVDDIVVTLVDDLAGNITATATPDATSPKDAEIVCIFTNIVTNILKVDAKHNEIALKGAVIKVYDDSTDPSTEVCTIKTGTTPSQIENLAVGKIYRLHEESAPHGYLPWAFDAWFTVDADGVITVGEYRTGNAGQTAANDSIIWVENGVIMVKDTMKKVSISVHKVWDDDNNRDGVRPMLTGITVSLLRNGVEYKTVKLEPANNWTAMVKDLDAVYVLGDKIYEYTYSWSEPTVKYYNLDPNQTKIYPVTLSSMEAGDATLSILTNKHTPDTTSIQVKKIWNDKQNAAGKRTPSVTVELYADGEAIDRIVLDASNDWEYTWTKLRKCANPTGLSQDSREITYTVAELDIPDEYTVQINPTSKGFEIFNTYIPGKLEIEKAFDIEPWEPFTPDDSPKDIPVIKTWNDNNNKDGNRPAAITVHLFADGVEVASAQLTEETGWKYTFTGLPRLREDKQKIVYTVTEDPVEWYEAEIHGFNIRNNYKPELTSVSVHKVWDDNNNALKLRPTSIAMTLSNGMVVILNAENGWTDTIENLPTRVNGEPVVYTWVEQKVVSYDQTGMETVGDTTTFTNKVWKRPEKTTGGKKPKTPGEPYETIDEYETPLGVEVIINHVGDCFD